MRSLKNFLTALVVGAVLPVLLFSIIISWRLAVDMRHATEQEARILAAQLADDVGEHVRMVATAMKVLARSPALAREDIKEAYQHASMLAADLDQHIGLATADGEQLFNTRRPFGADLPRRAEATSYKRALQTGEVSVSDVVVGAVAKRPLITIDVPVYTGFGPRVLGTSTDLEVIGAIIDRNPLKPGWKAAIVDSEGRFIARTLNPEQHLGKSASPAVVEIAKSSQQSGASRHHSLEGDELYSFFHKVEGTNWTVVVGTPEQNLLAPLRLPLAALGVAGLAALGITLSVAVVLSQRLSAAAGRLTEGAMALGENRELPPISQTIVEFEKVESVLHEAARQNHERQDALNQAREVAETSVEAKNRFLAGASHDLRQPLHAQGWCIELLKQATTDPNLTRYIDGLEQTHGTMTGLIDCLFEIARMDAGDIPPKLAEVHLPSLLDHVLLECRPAAEEKGLDLRRSAFPDVTITTDHDMLARILRNLVHNAIRYTDKGGVLLACRRHDGNLCLEVWDTGIGIPPDRLELIWEEFFQVGESKQTKGSGLGLSIVERLARALNYQLEVKSVHGKGSLFRVMIPA
ncbi:MAG TPA: sensor histidine kinase [Magnetospirillum sp.]|jgi:signal transduction histidine kinase|nr:sensor histidine kinase [Magnetospirillum sp.]